MHTTSGRPILIDSIHGPVLIAVVEDHIEVPDDKARICPQCGQKAWAGSRFCWACSWDFDRAAMKRFHPVKLLALSASLNVCSAIILVWQAAQSFLRWTL